MSRYLMEATLFLEDYLKSETHNEENNSKVLKCIENPKSIMENFKCTGDPVNDALISLTKHAGFDSIDDEALKSLRKVMLDKIKLISRQYSCAYQRKADGLRIPYQSPLIWALSLNDVENVILLKNWYENVYTSRLNNAIEKCKNLIITADS